MSWKFTKKRENFKEGLICNVKIYEALIEIKFKKMNFKLLPRILLVTLINVGG